MKTTKSILVSLVLILFVSVSAFAQSNSKVIAVVNHADWCSACKNNGERAQAVFKANNADGTIQFVVNNLTNDETKAQSAETLKKLGLGKAMAEYKGTGVVYFFDANSKKLINNVSVAKSDQKIAQALSTAKSGAM